MKFKPFNYQQYCIDRIINDSEVGLFLDMGLGKTVITLTAIQTLLSKQTIKRILIIAPKRVASSTWTDEVQKWDHLQGLSLVRVLGSAKQREEALQTQASVYVINRENVCWLVEHLGRSWNFDMVVLDELTSFKSPSAKRFKVLARVRSKIGRVVGLTGTPAPNGLLDLWGQIYLLDEGARLGRSLTQYREAYFYPVSFSGYTVYEYAPKDGAQEKIQKALQDLCISMKSEDYLELPDRIFIDVPIELGAKAKKAYKTLKREMILELMDETGSATITAPSSATLSSKLLQLCNGTVYDGDQNGIFVHDAKIEALQELVESLNGQPVLIFYEFKHDIDRIKNALSGRIEMLHDETLNDWNAGKIDVLLAHPASCAYGLNLQQGGHYIIWFGLNWSLELYEQANKRLHRQGQKDNVIIYRLMIKDGLDQQVAIALSQKATTQEAILKALQAQIDEED